MGRDEELHWNLLNGKTDMLSYINTFFTHMPSTLAMAAMKRTSRRHTQNIRRVFRHSTQLYRNGSRLKGCVIVDAKKQYFQVWMVIPNFLLLMLIK
jgi:hypothetical protein